MVACLTQFIKKGKFEADNLSSLCFFITLFHLFILTSQNLIVIIGTSITSASIASFVLGGIVMFIIIVSKKLKLNPDNIATPIASSLGDLVTLAILSGIGTLYYKTSTDLINFFI